MRRARPFGAPRLTDGDRVRQANGLMAYETGDMARRAIRAVENRRFGERIGRLSSEKLRVLTDSVPADPDDEAALAAGRAS